MARSRMNTSEILTVAAVSTAVTLLLGKMGLLDPIHKTVRKVVK